jgi:integrase
MRPLSEADAFLEAARESSDRFEALYVLAIATGLWRGELLSLRWDDVDLERGTLFMLGRAPEVSVLERDSIQKVPESAGASLSRRLLAIRAISGLGTGTFSLAWQSSIVLVESGGLLPRTRRLPPQADRVRHIRWGRARRKASQGLGKRSSVYRPSR